MAFVIVGLPGILVALLVRLTVREPVRGGSEHQPLNVRQYSLKEVWQFLSQLPSGRRISLAAACIAFAGYGLAAWIPAFFVRIHHMTPGQLGLWMSWITALGGIIGSFSGGVISDRWGRTYPRARAYVSMSGALLSIPFNVASVLLDDYRLALCVSCRPRSARHCGLVRRRRSCKISCRPPCAPRRPPYSFSFSPSSA